MDTTDALAFRTLHIHLLGGFRLEEEAEMPPALAQPRLQFLLAYLLLHRQAPVSRQQLAFALWPDSTEEQAYSNLLHRLRAALPGSERLIRFDRHQVWWQGKDGAWLDVAAFDAALAAAAATEEVADLPRACIALEDAAALYGDELLPTCYDDWIAPERERLHQAHLNALQRLIAHLEQLRAYDKAIYDAQALARLDPLHEPACCHLMRRHLARGDRAAALRAYHDLATVLRRELGVDPGVETQAIYLEVLRSNETPAARAAALPADITLIGRQVEWAQLHAAWKSAAAGRPHMALIVGETGIGKTRLVAELVGWAERHRQTTASIRCSPTDIALAYASVVGLLRAPALERRLARLDKAWLAELSRLLPELSTTHPDLASPGPMTEAWQRQRLFQAWRPAGMRQTDRRPCCCALMICNGAMRIPWIGCSICWRTPVPRPCWRRPLSVAGRWTARAR